jgi:hypothetical protein
LGEFAHQPAEFREPFGYARTKAPHIGHGHHLCSMAENGEVSLEQIKDLVRNAKFICKVCARTAVNSDNLCEPEAL